MDNNKVTLFHLLSATAASKNGETNNTRNTLSNKQLETAPKAHQASELNYQNPRSLEVSTEATTITPTPQKSNTLSNKQLETRPKTHQASELNYQNPRSLEVSNKATTITPTLKDINLEGANMRTYASNISTTPTPTFKETSTFEAKDGTIVQEDFLLKEDALTQDSDLIESPAFEELEASKDRIDPELLVQKDEEQAMETSDFLDDPTNFDTEDIDEAYRKRLIALGLEPIEEIELAAEKTPIFVESPEQTELSETETEESIAFPTQKVEEVDNALSDVFANPPVTLAPKQEVDLSAQKSAANFSPLQFRVDEHSTNTTTTNPVDTAQSKASMLQQFRQLQDRNSTFVFMFGRQQAGKTVVLSSLAYHLGVDENGLLETRRRADNLKGAAYLKQLSQSVRKGQFMNRTAVGSLYELDLTYTPNKPEIPMNFTFLEMSGEDLTKVELSESSAGQLPNDIDVYLKCPNLNLIFMMVVPYEDAEEHDYLVIDFLDYLKERKPDLDYSKVLLLISKWDRYEGLRKNEVDVFVKEQMPRTYSRLKAKKATIARYSVGEVSEDGQNIVELNRERPEVIKKWLYQSVTGQKIKEESASIWNKFKKWM